MSSKNRNPIPKEFNIGPVIRTAMRQKGATQTILGRKTDRKPVTVMNLLKRRSIQVSIVYEFSLAMETDLFHALSQTLPAHIRTDERDVEIQVLKDRLAVAELEMARQKEDNAYLKKMIDILARDR